LDSADLYVVYTSLAGADTQWTENTEYTVTNIGEEEGGNVVVDELYVPSSGTHLTIYREVPYTQESDYVENDPFHADTLETDLDRIVMIIQQLSEALGRVLKVPITDDGASFVLPFDRANKFLKFDSDKSPIAVFLPDLTTVSPSVDNRITRYDGTNSLQGSLVSIDDEGNVITPGGNLATETYVDTVSGAIQTSTQNYVDTVSGAIQTSTQNYVDTVSGALQTAIDNVGGGDALEITMPAANQTAQGLILTDGVAGENLLAGQIVYRKSDGKFWRADFRYSTTLPAIAMAVTDVSAGATGNFLLNGVVRNDSWTWTAGNIIYVSITGYWTSTAPSSSGYFLQIIGVALTSTVMRFDPDYTIIEVE
jgi:hypothetical protein